MDKPFYNRQVVFEAFASIAVFLLLLIFTYGIFVKAPYAGFYFNPTSEQIEMVFVEDPSLLKAGDIVKQIGAVPLKQFKADRRLTLFEGVQTGDVIEITIIREGSDVVIPWEFPGFTWRELTNRLLNSWVLAYAFGVAGLAAQLTLRPRNLRRGLFITANYLTALFLISGMLSSWHLWESSTLLHAVSWLMLPVFLHLHWLFPHPFKKNIPNLIVGLLYGSACLLALGEAFHILSRSLYVLGFILAIFGSALLLFAHLIIQKKQRPVIRLLLLSILVSFSLSISVAIALSLDVVLNLGWLTFVSMPFMPLMYFYVIYRHQSSGLQIRLNRFVSLYTYLIMIGILLLSIVIIAARRPISHETWIFIALALAAATGILSILFFPRFQAFVDQRFLGIKLPYQHLPETYSSRIASSVKLPDLLKLLEEEVFPSLFVRQYVFLQANEKKLHPLLSKDIPVHTFEFDLLTRLAGSYIPSLPPHEDWLRLILPLKVGDKTLGFWLLGKRDPDDLYPQVEISILQSLADQTAIALSNILQTEQLKRLYQANIKRNEQERQTLAHELHDSVLNQLAILHNSLDENTLPSGFIPAYEELKRQLRKIVHNLRPPMLTYGFVPAINDLADGIMERSEDQVKVSVTLQAAEENIPDHLAPHLYRIIQEACENVLRHAHASHIAISGSLSPKNIHLSIEDNGAGFKVEDRLQLDALLANNHFGLAGMKERAFLIDADIEIRSQPNRGTQVQVRWAAGEEPSLTS